MFTRPARKLLEHPVALTAAVALVAAAARLPGTFTQALSQDEVASARILREPAVVPMLSRVARTESTPPLWYAMGWLIHRAGVPIVDVRLLSVLAGAGLAATVVAVGRRVLPPAAAALAGILVAVGGEFVAHGNELRAYELLAFLTAALALLLLRELDAPSRRMELAIGLVVALGGLTHYFFGLAAVAALAWVWADPGARHIRRRVSVAIAAGGLVAIAWAPVMFAQFHRDRFWWIGAFHLRPVLAVPLRLFTTAYADRPSGLVLSLALLAIVSAGCVRLGRMGAHGRLIVVLGVGPLFAAGALWAGGVQIFALRNLIEIGPAVALAFAALVAAVPVRLALAGGTAAVVLVALSTVAQQGVGTPPFAAIAHTLVAEGWRPSEPVAVVGNLFVFRSPLGWYLPHTPLLDAARPRASVCRTVFLVAPRRLRRRIAGLITTRDDAGRFVVSRLALRVPLGDVHMLRRAAILVDAAAAPRCVSAIRTGRLAPIT
jgi:4-amino-4-deoxy-L-arabinose transferase-like glycosyltransferase